MTATGHDGPAPGEHRRVRIRRAVSDDAGAIAAVHVRSWQIGYREQLPDIVLDALAPEQRVPRWTTILSEAAWPSRGVLVAEETTDGALLGFADLRPTRDPDLDPLSVGEITSLYVAPQAWRSGVGRRLLDACTTTLADAGHLSSTLWVLAGNERAIRFYEASGWRPDGATKEDTIAGVDVVELRYRRSLPA